MLVDAHAGGPARLLLLVDGDLEGERVAALRGYRGDVVLVRVGKRNDLHGRGEERLLHGAADLGAFCEREHCVSLTMP